MAMQQMVTTSETIKKLEKGFIFRKNLLRLKLRSHTFLAGLAVSSVQKQEPWRLWQEGQGGELK